MAGDSCNVSYIVLRLADDSFVHVSFHNHGDDEVNRSRRPRPSPTSSRATPTGEKEASTSKQLNSSRFPTSRRSPEGSELELAAGDDDRRAADLDALDAAPPNPSTRANKVDGLPISVPCSILISSPKASRLWRARCSASGPAAEPVAGSSGTPPPGARTCASSSCSPRRRGHRRRAPLRRCARRLRSGRERGHLLTRAQHVTYTCWRPLS